MAAALLLCLPGPGLAAGRPDAGETAAQSGNGYETVGSSSRPLARGAGYAAGGDRTRVREVQRELRNWAYAPGPIDGLYGPLTEGAVRRFQQAHGLAVDGVVGPQTREALRTARIPPGDEAVRPGAGYRTPGGSGRVLEIQRMLRGLGYESGPLDGLFGPRTQAAVQWFQVHRGLRPTGVVGPATLTRLRALGRSSPGIEAATVSSERGVPPLPSAGWRGRPIRNPHRHATGGAAAQVERPAGRERPLRSRAGYGSAAGSRQVRGLQRRLRRLDYRPGPVDGLFGPQTKAAVQWFQMKHGLRPSGIADAATLAHLRALAVGGRPARRAPKRATAPTRPAGAAMSSRAANDGGGGIVPLLLLAVAAFAAALVSVLMLRRSGPGRAERVPPPDERVPPPDERVPPPDERVPPPDPDPVVGPPASTAPLSGNGHAAPPAPPQPPATRTPSPLVVGYASGSDRAELEGRAAAVAQACRERGSTLTCVIRENGSADGGGRKRPGLAHAVKQLHEGRAGGLVVDRLEHLGRSGAEIRDQLEWFLDNGVDLVAVDVGLDTATEEGLLAAGRLLNGRSHTRT